MPGGQWTYEAIIAAKNKTHLNKIKAVKVLRRESNLNLSEAIQFIDGFIHGYNLNNKKG